MAEGLVNYYLGDEWQAVSVRTEPAGYVHPLAIRVMDELGIDISHHRSKATCEFRDADLDLVVTVCDDAAENCPVWLGRGERRHMGLQDPARATGGREERLAVFHQVRDAMRREVSHLLVGGNIHSPAGDKHDTSNP
jgi:arsenate reductase